MPIGTTPVPYHTGGRGAIRTLDKGFHRVKRKCSINRFVSITHGDSLAFNPPFNRAMLKGLERALNHNRPPGPLMNVVPGTIAVNVRGGDELSPLWTITTSPNLLRPGNEDFPTTGPVGPNGLVQVFPFSLPGDPLASFTLTLTPPLKLKRFILGYIREPGAGKLVVKVNGAQVGPPIDCNGSAPAVALLRTLVSPTPFEGQVTVERFEPQPGEADPRVLAYHFDLNADENQLMHCPCAVPGAGSVSWDGVRSRMNEWWRLLANLSASGGDRVGVDMVYWNTGGADDEVNPLDEPTVVALQKRIRNLLTQTLRDHAIHWANIEFRVGINLPSNRPPDLPAGLPYPPPYSYAPLVIYNLPHERSFVPTPLYYIRSVGIEAVNSVGPTPEVPFPAAWGPVTFSADAFNSQWYKTQPGVPVPPPALPPLERPNYLDPRRFTEDGIHYNDVGGQVHANELLRLLVFPDLNIGEAVLDFDGPPTPEEGPCPSSTTYIPLTAAGDGPTTGEGPVAGEEGPTGEEPTEGGWVISDEGPLPGA